MGATGNKKPKAWKKHKTSYMAEETNQEIMPKKGKKKIEQRDWKNSLTGFKSWGCPKRQNTPLVESDIWFQSPIGDTNKSRVPNTFWTPSYFVIGIEG